MAVFLVLLIIISTVVFHIIFLKKKEEQFLDLYHNELQVKNKLLSESILLYLKGNEANGWDSFLENISREDSIDDSTWLYVAYNGVPLYFKNQDLLNNNTISLQKFIKQLQIDSKLTTQNTLIYNDGTITIGLIAEKKMVLMDWGYSNLNMVLLLECILVTLLLSLIGGYFIWKTRRESKKVIRYQKEVVSLNCKVEEISQKLNWSTLEKDNEELSQLKLQEFKYDTDLVKLLLRKINDIAYLPVTIYYVQFDMSNLYFTKKKISEIEEQLHVQLSHKYELFEIGKGEFVYIMVRSDIKDVKQSIKQIKERAEDIAKDNGIKVTVKSRTITNITEDPLIEFENLRS